MIQVNELRIGNKVLYDTDEGKKLCTIDGTDISIMQNKPHYANQHYPTLLSDKVLLACGFKKGKVKGVTRFVDDINDIDPNDKNKWTYYWDLKVPENNQVEDLRTFSLVQFGKGCDILWKHQMLSVKITSLHQLQNIYYSLTGTELEVNLPSKGLN